ncbi:sodium:proton antiporter [Myxococcota bacterium]|nr:sodium:proton antiporter [Myxococcota bacterium]MBU1431808.1 sodium:proton antiporter [Myxococcota bacterium]MBU1896654.1 sodium:proton antiporter [Myxococcota bacterium]
MKALISLIALLFLGVTLWQLLPFFAPAEVLQGVAAHYVQQGVVENRGANIVTSVIVNYRGLDTLGEVVVLFLSVTGVGFVLRRRGGVCVPKPTPASEIVETGARLLMPPVLLFGAYIFIHGHLTPGGGFQGGAVVASAVLLLLLANRDRHLPHALLSWVESLSGLAYVVVGLLGLIGLGSFLGNDPEALGVWNRLFSAGIIPIIYVLIGLKVGSELSALLEVMTQAGERE